MNAYDLLMQSAQKGNGRTLTAAQVIWILQLIQNMDAALVAYANDENDEVVDAEVIDDEQVLEGEGQDGEVAGVDSSESEEEE